MLGAGGSLACRGSRGAVSPAAVGLKLWSGWGRFLLRFRSDGACAERPVARERSRRPREPTPHPSPTAHPRRRPRSAPLTPFRPPPARVRSGSSNFAPFRIRALTLSASSPVIGFGLPGSPQGTKKEARAGVWIGGGGAGASAGRRAVGSAASALLLLRPRRGGGWTLIPGRGGVGEGFYPLPQDSHTSEMGLINGEGVALYHFES